jgi:hypothetical protein
MNRMYLILIIILLATQVISHCIVSQCPVQNTVGDNTIGISTQSHHTPLHMIFARHLKYNSIAKAIHHCPYDFIEIEFMQMDDIKQ